jgi:hypothetical protein
MFPDPGQVAYGFPARYRAGKVRVGLRRRNEIPALKRVHMLEGNVSRRTVSCRHLHETLMRWAVGQVKTVPLPEDPSVPIWIRETDSYKTNLLHFDDASKPIVLCLAYYLGECFVRGFSGLAWAVGSHETALTNMPVVSGFGNGIELAPCW